MKVLLVDDHPLFLEGLLSLFATHGIAVAGTARNGLEALEKARYLEPDVILMDLQMPGCGGLLATRLIKAELPQIKIVILTVSEDEDDLFEAIKNGASGYLLKKLQAKELVDLLAELENGEPPLAPGLAIKILDELARGRREKQEEAAAKKMDMLTPRQATILALIAQGHTYRQVATALRFSERTIKYEVKQILERLRVENRNEAIACAARAGLTAT